MPKFDFSNCSPWLQAFTDWGHHQSGKAVSRDQKLTYRWKCKDWRAAGIDRVILFLVTTKLSIKDCIFSKS